MLFRKGKRPARRPPFERSFYKLSVWNPWERSRNPQGWSGIAKAEPGWGLGQSPKVLRSSMPSAAVRWSEPRSWLCLCSSGSASGRERQATEILDWRAFTASTRKERSKIDFPSAWEMIRAGTQSARLRRNRADLGGGARPPSMGKLLEPPSPIPSSTHLAAP